MEIWEHYQDTSLGDIQDMLGSSHSQIIELIESFTDEELFTKSTSRGQEPPRWAPTWSQQHPATTTGIKKLRTHQKANKASPKAPNQTP